MTSETIQNGAEYQNDQVKVVVHYKPRCMVEYEVETSSPLCQEAQKKAARSVGKEVMVPGFRKGKAPLEIVAKRYPHELDKRWQEEIANAAYRESSQLAKVPVIHQDATISFKMHSHTKESAKLTLSFETFPDIPSVDPVTCVLEEVKRPEVSKAKVDETIRQTQMFFSHWKKIENHLIKANDFVLLDVDIIEVDPPQRLFSNTRFEVSDKSMAKWMQKLITGKKVGDVLEGVSTPDPELSEEEKNEYPPKKVRVTIKAIEEVDLPPLDDDFAKKLGVGSVKELEQKIEALLHKKADEHVRELKREKVVDFLLSYHFDMPRSVIEKETQFRLQQMMQDPSFKKRWEESRDQERQNLVQEVYKQAEKAVRMFYICRKIAADQKISVSPQDLSLRIDPLEQLLYPSAQPHDPRQPDIKQAEAYSRILLEKAEDWVISHSRIEPKKEKKEQPSSKEPEEEKPKKKAAVKSSEKPKKKEAAAPKKPKK